MSREALDHIIAQIPNLTHQEKEQVERELSFRPRCTALAIIQREDGKILVNRGEDATRDLIFYRPPGGGIDFGETAEAAVVREISEEMNIEARSTALLQVVENIFTYKGVDLHEILFLIQAELIDPELYAVAEIACIEPGREDSPAVWRSLEEIQAEGAVLFPEILNSIL